MLVVQNTYPSNLPADFDDLKTNQLRVDNDLEDVVIASKIKAAARIIEQYTNRILLSSTFTAYLDCLPNNNVVEIMKFPITSIDSVKYYNESGVLTTMALGTDYVIDIKDCPARVRFRTSPNIQSNIFNGIEIAFTAGHANYKEIDNGISEVLKLITGQLYEQRQNESSTHLSESSLNYKTILNLYVKGSYIC